MGTSELISLQLRMFIVMLAGLLFRKKNIITSEGKKTLTDLVIYLILPCNIVKSFMIEFDGSVLKSFGLVLVISTGIQVMCGISWKSGGGGCVWQYWSGIGKYLSDSAENRYVVRRCFLFCGCSR